MKKTPWFHHAINPARVGQYEVRYDFTKTDATRHLWWDGHRWIDAEHGTRYFMWGHGNDQWRGLASKDGK